MMLSTAETQTDFHMKLSHFTHLITHNSGWKYLRSHSNTEMKVYALLFYLQHFFFLNGVNCKQSHAKKTKSYILKVNLNLWCQETFERMNPLYNTARTARTVYLKQNVPEKYLAARANWTKWKIMRFSVLFSLVLW